MNYSLPDSFAHGIFQASILKWGAISYSRGSFQPRDWTRVSYISCTGRQLLYHWRLLGSPLNRKGARKCSLATWHEGIEDGYWWTVGQCLLKWSGDSNVMKQEKKTQVWWEAESRSWKLDILSQCCTYNFMMVGLVCRQYSIWVWISGWNCWCGNHEHIGDGINKVVTE